MEQERAVMCVRVLSSVWQYVSVYVHSSRYTQTAGLRGEEEKRKVRKERIRWRFFFKFTTQDLKSYL